MIDRLDNRLHRFFRDRLADLAADGQVRVRAPDNAWCAQVPGRTDAIGDLISSLKLYLTDVREARRREASDCMGNEIRVVQTSQHRHQQPHQLFGHCVEDCSATFARADNVTRGGLGQELVGRGVAGRLFVAVRLAGSVGYQDAIEK